MKIKKLDRIAFSEMLIFLLVINYMVVTILLNDNVVLKYLRDVILIGLIGLSITKMVLKKSDFRWLIFILILIITFFKSDDMRLSIISLRKYIFPIFMFVIGCKYTAIDKNKLSRLINYIIILMSIISAWGIFQAWILGDEFLKKIGYAVSYKYGYGRDMLNYSFYFGGLGIQRVVSTLSNSNVCGLILGVTLVLGAYFYQNIRLKYKNVCLIIIGLGFILTFSRSNFLAIVIITIFVMYPYIPQKNKIKMILLGALLILFILGILQGQSGLLYKIGNWIMSTINMTDTSASGRLDIWSEAFWAVLKNPLGLGFGHVGAIARDANIQKLYECENSYFAIALDCGVLALFLYIYNIFKVYRKFKLSILNSNNDFQLRACKCGISLLLYMMIVFWFSNHIYDMEAIGILWFYVGIMINLLESSNSI